MGLLFFISPAKKHENLLITFLDCCFGTVLKDTSKQILRNTVKVEAKYTEIQVYCSSQATKMTSSEPLALLFSLQHTYCPSHLVTEMAISSSILLHLYCRRNSEMSDQQICLGVQLFQSYVREPQGFLPRLAVKPQPTAIESSWWEQKDSSVINKQKINSPTTLERQKDSSHFMSDWLNSRNKYKKAKLWIWQAGSSHLKLGNSKEQFVFQGLPHK